MIKLLKKLIKKNLSSKSNKEEVQPPSTKEPENTFTSNYVGVPAPVVPPSDPWFQDPPRIQKQMDYMEKETEIKRQEEVSINKTKESNDIHLKMYEIASKNCNTVVETQGGSENFQSGLGSWNSGNGMGQLIK